MMSPIKYVVVSTPRSATGWISEVLTRMGLHCGHERHFDHDKQVYLDTVPSDRIWGDSSWMAVPFIEALPPRTLVLHQTRNPVDAIGSLVMLGHFGHWGRALDEYHIFMRTHMRDAMPEGEIRKAAHFWLRWNEMIETALASRPDLERIRYKIERPYIAKMLYEQITGHLTTKDVRRKGESVPTDFNHKRGRPKQVVSMHTLSPAVNAMARRYEY